MLDITVTRARLLMTIDPEQLPSEPLLREQVAAFTEQVAALTAN